MKRRFKRQISFGLVMAVALTLLFPSAETFAQTAEGMTINASGVLTAYTGGGGAVTIPSNVTSIGAGAFSGKSITGITIPGSVRSIGDNAFANCTGLSGVTIPNSVTSIGAGAFSGCTSLNSVSMQAAVSSIPANCFSGCSSLTSIAITAGVGSIGSGAFSGCASLSSIAIPSGVGSIGANAFSNCTSLSAISIPASTTSIGSGALSGCSSLSTIKVASGNSAYASDGGSLYNAAMTKLVMVPVAKTGMALYSGVKIIGSGAFAGCRNISSVKLPDGANKIEGGAFSGSGVTSLTIPASVTSIGAQSGWSPEIIYGYDGTAAESFAMANGYVFSSLGGGGTSGSDEDVSTTETFTSGDSTSVTVDGGDGGSATADAGESGSTGSKKPSGKNTAGNASSGSTASTGSTSSTGAKASGSGSSVASSGGTSGTSSGAYSGTTSDSHTLDQTPQTGDGSIDAGLFLVFALVLAGCGLMLAGKRKTIL